jgi:hypothetical protein
MGGRGFALVDTPRRLDDLFLKRKRSVTLRPFHSRRFGKYPELARHGRWLEELLREALPEESLFLAALEFRYEPAGFADPQVDRRHADGSYLRSVYTHYGPSTIYRDRKSQAAVPHGQTLVMTAMDRARAVGLPCTLHRRPGPGSERAVIVCSFESRRKQPQPPDAA